MNTVILNGSPRSNGNTMVLINLFEKALKQKKYKFVRHDLYRLQIKGCALRIAMHARRLNINQVA